VQVKSFQSLDGPPSEITFPSSTSELFIQYSSGSTNAPRGIVLETHAVEAQLSMLERALKIDPERDTALIWLPLSHDMGFFGCLLLTYWTRGRLVVTPPERFVFRPATWFDDVARHGATITAASPVALRLAARAARSQTERLKTQLRLTILGGERIDPHTVRNALHILGPSCLPPSSIVSAYGLAESVLAVTIAEGGTLPRSMIIDEAQLTSGLVVPVDASEPFAMEYMSCGPPLPGVDLFSPIAGRVDAIRFRSPAAASGVISPSGNDTVASDGTVTTTDLGFVDDGELFVTGRQDDILSVDGRNLSARLVEDVLLQTGELRRGHFAAVSVEVGGRDSLVLLVEDQSAYASIRPARKAIMQSLGVRLGEVVSLDGPMPYTPSGKLQRHKCRLDAKRQLSA
jgi:fatty-acyl-CoA synthase